jgi:DNA-binding CsgD family transcriptional regulator
MPTLLPELTRQEQKVLGIMGEGICRNTTIGERLHISPNTVKNHKENLKAKFGVETCEALLQLAVKMKTENEN